MNIDEKRALKKQLSNSISVYTRTIRIHENLLENDRSLINRKMKTHLEILGMLYTLLARLHAEYDKVVSEIQSMEAQSG